MFELFIFSRGPSMLVAEKEKEKRTRHTGIFSFSFWSTEKNTTYFMYLARKSGRKPEGEGRIRHFQTQV